MLHVRRLLTPASVNFTNSAAASAAASYHLIRAIPAAHIRFVSWEETWKPIHTETLLSQVTKDRFKVSFARSSGPGGQHVNTTDSKAVLRLPVQAASWIPVEIRAKLIEQQKNIINKEGELIISSEKTRVQADNVDDALDRVKQMLKVACFVRAPPSEESLKLKKEREDLKREKKIAKQKVERNRKNHKNNLY